MADRLGQYVSAYTLYSSVRPFGCSTIVGAVNEDGTSALYMVEPSGVYWVKLSFFRFGIELITKVIWGKEDVCLTFVVM